MVASSVKKLIAEETNVGSFKIAPTRLKREGEDEVWKGGYHAEIVETK